MKQNSMVMQSRILPLILMGTILHKISLLASLAFGTIFDFDEIPARGIRGIDKRDVRFAKKFGYQIKLLAFAKLEKALVGFQWNRL